MSTDRKFWVRAKEEKVFRYLEIFKTLIILAHDLQLLDKNGPLPLLLTTKSETI